VILGGLFLLNNFGIIRFNWGFVWPIFLILAGVWVLLGISRRGPAQVEQASLPLEGATSAQVTLEHGAGKLNLIGPAERGTLVAGAFGGGIDARVKRDGSAVRLHLKRPDTGFDLPFLFGGQGEWTWDFRLTDAIPLELRVKGSAGMLDLDLSGLKVTDLHIDGGVGTTTVKLPAAAGHTKVKIDGGVGTVSLRIPEGVAARIKTDSGLGTTTVDEGRFAKVSEHEYQSADYERAEQRADIKVDGGVGTVTIR
jgi:hypothetical protein